MNWWTLPRQEKKIFCWVSKTNKYDVLTESCKNWFFHNLVYTSAKRLGALYIGLGKKFVQVFPYSVMEKLQPNTSSHLALLITKKIGTTFCLNKDTVILSDTQVESVKSKILTQVCLNSKICNPYSSRPHSSLPLSWAYRPWTPPSLHSTPGTARKCQCPSGPQRWTSHCWSSPQWQCHPAVPLGKTEGQTEDKLPYTSTYATIKTEHIA